MDATDSLLGGLASGDTAPGSETKPAMKRDQDSTDDFEHLDREGKRDDTSESPIHHHGAARTATQSFLDMERDELFVDTPRAPSVADKLADHIADKFTDSESDADTAGESPMHRPEPSQQKSSTSVPEHPTSVPPPVYDFTSPLESNLATAATPPPTPAPVPTPAPSAPEAIKETHPEPKFEAPVPTKVEPPHVAPASEPLPPQESTKPKTTPPEPQPKTITKEPQPQPEVKQEPARAPIAHVIEAEVIFCQMGLVESLIYWRSAARSGAALGGGLALLLALASCSVVSVLAYAALLALAAAVAFRIYRNVLQAVQKTSDGHPFKWLLEQDISVPAERAQALAAAATAHLNATTHELRRLFLVEDLVDSLKFGVLLWCLTYVGACFNGITLIILGWVALFTLPKAYEMNKAQVDANLELARAKINEITAKVRAAVPLGRKAESEKDK